MAAIDGITKKLFEFQKLRVKVKKTLENPYFKSKYSDINKIQDEIIPILNDLNILIKQCIVSDDNGNYVVTKLVDIEDGSFIESKIKILVVNNDPQKAGSSITYNRRYALVTMLCLEQIDDDANEAAGNVIDKTKNVIKRTNFVVNKKSQLKQRLIAQAKGKSKVEIIELMAKLSKDEKSLIGESNLTNTLQYLLKVNGHTK